MKQKKIRYWASCNKQTSMKPNYLSYYATLWYPVDYQMIIRVSSKISRRRSLLNIWRPRLTWGGYKGQEFMESCLKYLRFIFWCVFVYSCSFIEKNFNMLNLLLFLLVAILVLLCCICIFNQVLEYQLKEWDIYMNIQITLNARSYLFLSTQWS